MIVGREQKSATVRLEPTTGFFHSTGISHDSCVAAMDSRSVLAQLDERIDKLCLLGVERGLSAAEIDDCIIKSVNVEKRNGKRQKRKSSMRSGRRHFCCVAAGSCAAFWVVVAAVYGLATVHKPTEKLVLKLLQPYVYPFLRNIRLAGLPILRRYDVSGNFNHHQSIQCGCQRTINTMSIILLLIQ